MLFRLVAKLRTSLHSRFMTAGSSPSCLLYNLAFDGRVKIVNPAPPNSRLSISIQMIHIVRDVVLKARENMRFPIHNRLSSHPLCYTWTWTLVLGCVDDIQKAQTGRSRQES